MLIEILNRDVAQQEFKQLVDDNRAKALWFMNQAVPVDITGSYARSILDSIAQKGGRSDWMKSRKLRKWLLQNSK